MTMRGTTICAVKRGDQVAIAGDGQVTMGENTVFKSSAKKVRRLYNGQVIAGFAGAVSDAFTLCERFEEKLTQCGGNLERAAVSLAQDWRSDTAIRKLESMLIVADRNTLLVLSGTGEVIDPDDGVCATPPSPPRRLRSSRWRWPPPSASLPTTISAWKRSRRQVMNELTPREIMRELDRYIIGQDEAKRAVAIALRNRYRRAQLDEDIRNEISPKNILMIGPTGVGKTEIARRLAKLVKAPFVKVEATKFTEVGYVGRDVESIIRDLTENAIRIVRKEFSKRVETRAAVLAEDRLVSLLVNPPKKSSSGNPFEFFLGGKKEPEIPREEQEKLAARREDVREQLRSGALEERELEIEVEDELPQLEVGGNSINIGDMMGGMMPKKTKIRRVKVKEARKILLEEESDKLIDEDEVREEAIHRAEQQGIVFIDEIDKVAGRSSGGHGPDVSREGVQRDILPIVEGSTVNTKYGAVRTDFMLFIAAGAFHVAKVSDLIPELQGRFPVHVTLKSLTQEDFKAILTQPENALTRQYEALLAVDKVFLSFEDSAIDAIAHAAYVLNETKEDIGARRLFAVFEKLLEDISFNAGGDEMPNVYLNINGDYVVEHLGKDEVSMDLKRYIL